MRGIRVYRGVAVLTSLAAVAMGPQSVIGESSTPSKFSSRFLNSLAHADNAFEEQNNNNAPLDSLPEDTAKHELRDDVVNDSRSSSRHQRRELLSWWSLAIQFAHGPCPPPDVPHQPHHCQHGSGSGGSGGSSGGGSGGGEGSDGSGGSGSSGAGGGSGGGGYGGGGGGGSGSSSSSGGGGGGTSGSHSKALLSPGSLSFWMLLSAASAAAIAVGAMIIGSRRKAKAKYHPLKGSLERRMKLFGGMADGCFEDRELCGAQNGSGLGGSGEMGKSGLVQEEPLKGEYQGMV